MKSTKATESFEECRAYHEDIAFCHGYTLGVAVGSLTPAGTDPIVMYTPE